MILFVVRQIPGFSKRKGVIYVDEDTYELDKDCDPDHQGHESVKDLLGCMASKNIGLVNSTLTIEGYYLLDLP
jgi:hypothetical protein